MSHISCRKSLPQVVVVVYLSTYGRDLAAGMLFDINFELLLIQAKRGATHFDSLPVSTGIFLGVWLLPFSFSN